MKYLLTSLLIFLNFHLAFSSSPDTLRVGYNIVPPFVTEQDGELTGPSVWLWKNMAEENGLDYTLERRPLNSLLAGLQTNQLDIGLSPLTITSDRSEVIDFTTPYYIAHASILQKKVSSAERALAFITSFFSLRFFEALGALALVIMIFGSLLWYFEKEENEEEFGKGLKGLWDGFWWSAVTMTTVGYGDKSPRSTGGRIVALVWMFTAIIIISGFTASIASALTVDRIGASSSSLEDFKEKTLGTIGNSATDIWLRDHFFTQKEVFPNLQAMMEALEQEKIDAVAYDRPVLQSLIANDSISSYTLLDVKFNPQFYAFGLNSQLPDSLKEQINISMLKNIEKMDWDVLLAEYQLE